MSLYVRKGTAFHIFGLLLQIADAGRDSMVSDSTPGRRHCVCKSAILQIQSGRMAQL